MEPNPPNIHSDTVQEKDSSEVTQEIARSLLSANTPYDTFPYVSRTV